MARDRRGVPSVYVSFFLASDTPVEVVAIESYPGRFALRLGDTSPEVSISCDNEALARLRDVISAHLDSQGGAS